MVVFVVTVVVAVVVLIVAVPQLDAVEKKVIKYFCLLADLCLSLFKDLKLLSLEMFFGGK